MRKKKKKLGEGSYHGKKGSQIKRSKKHFGRCLVIWLLIVKKEGRKQERGGPTGGRGNVLLKQWNLKTLLRLKKQCTDFKKKKGGGCYEKEELSWKPGGGLGGASPWKRYLHMSKKTGWGIYYQTGKGKMGGKCLSFNGGLEIAFINSGVYEKKDATASRKTVKD